MNLSKMNFGVLWCLLLLATSCSGKWRWPEGETAASVRIDTKVRFIDTDGDKEVQKNSQRVQADEVPFQEPDDTEGFYNRPPGAGRYPVRVEAHRSPYRVDGQGIFRVDNQQQQNVISDGTLDSLQFCKCVSTPDCQPRPDSERACGLGKFLCCYQRPNREGVTSLHNELYNEVPQYQRPVFSPGSNGAFERPGVLVGPGGPTGHIGPKDKPNEPAVLVGPGGPTGIIGPAQNNDGIRSSTAQRGVYAGPFGFGSYGRRPVLVGPGGPTGIIGPGRGGRPNVLVGPGGPTGIIGPGYGRQPGLLTGPGGPTGSIGPGRQILVGPGGPTGQIGPQGFYGCVRPKRWRSQPDDLPAPAPPNTRHTHQHTRNNSKEGELCYCNK